MAPGSWEPSSNPAVIAGIAGADGPMCVRLAQRLARRRPQLTVCSTGYRRLGHGWLPAAASALSPVSAPTQASSSLFLVSKADGQLLKEDQGSSLHPRDGGTC